MAIERTYHCEAPDESCPVHQRTGTPPPHLPLGWIETRTVCNGEECLHHFCSWDCCMKYAAAQPVAEVIEVD
jgi:hypothetical protein